MTRLPRAFLGVLGLFLSAAAALADENGVVGPPIGNNRYRGSLTDSTDVDDFTQDLLQGEKLTVFVRSTGTLLPVLTLVDPDGIIRFPDVRVSDDGLETSLPEFTIDKSGHWAARIEANSGTAGAYEVKFRLRTIGTIAADNQRLGNDEPFARTHEFSAFEGALLDATMVWDRRQLPVEMRALTDPSGNEVAAGEGTAIDLVETRGNRVSLKGISLGKGQGTYGLRVKTPTGTAKYDLKIRISPATARPSSKKPEILNDLEPLLDARTVPIGADVGTPVTFTGVNFSADPSTPPTVLFDRAIAANVSVASDGRSLTCTVPPRSGAEVVSITVTNPDGQASCRSRYFAYVPPPAITDIVDAGTLAPVRSGSTAGGRALVLLGANLLPGQVLNFGAATAADFNPTSATQGTFTLPASATTGNVNVSITDQFSRTVVASFTFFYKTPPAFAAQPYNPSVLQLNTSQTVTISGTGFESGDQLFFNNAAIPSTFVDSTTRTMLLGAQTAGAYPVHLVDAVGTRVDGPPLLVKLPPIVTSVTVSAGPFLSPNEIPLVGGSTVTVTGTDFTTTDVVVFGGATISSFASRSDTGFTFTAPAHAAGVVSLTVTDGAGQTATIPSAARHVGFTDTTTSRIVAATATENLQAFRGAAGDLDRDGASDDLVLISRTTDPTIGTESRRTRLFKGDASGKLQNATSSLPGARSDLTGRDVWDASAVAIGDVDGLNGNDIVIGGIGGNGYYYVTYKEVRLLKQGATAGSFTFDEPNSPPSRYRTGVTAYDSYGFGYQRTIFSSLIPQGSAAAIAIGDVDNDGMRDVIVANDRYDQRYAGLDPNYYVTYYYGRYYVNFRALYYGYAVYINQNQYYPGLRIFTNDIGTSGLVDESGSRLPGAGSSGDQANQPSALQARDMVLVNVEKGADTDLDIVLIWDDPETTTAFGRFSKDVDGAAAQAPKRALEILVNNGSGTFTNVSATALPAGSGSEYFQGNRVRAADLDNDGDQDLVILCEDGLNAWTGTTTHTASCLRILRNDGVTGSVRFTNVTSSAIPAVSASTQDDFRGNALLVRDVNGDTLPDILVGTTESVRNASNMANLPSTRLFTNAVGLRFRLQNEFMVPLGTDSGEAEDLLVVPDLGGTGLNPVFLVDTNHTRFSTNNENTRSAEWKR